MAEMVRARSLDDGPVVTRGHTSLTMFRMFRSKGSNCSRDMCLHVLKEREAVSAQADFRSQPPFSRIRGGCAAQAGA
jgi:hypothetical protein